MQHNGCICSLETYMYLEVHILQIISKGNVLSLLLKMQGNIARMAMHEVDNVRREIAQCKMRSEAMEVSRAELLKELENTRRHMNELKVKLDKAEADESKFQEEVNHAKHYMEIAKMFAREGGKSEVDKVKTQQEAAVSELISVREEIKSLNEECTTLAKERENLVAKAEEEVAASKKAETMVEELMEELANARKSLEIATVAKQEKEGRKVSAGLEKDEERLTWKKEIREAEEELLQLSMQVASAKELEGKLEVATSLLEKLNAELEVYMQKLDPENNGVHNEEVRKKQKILDKKTKELDEVKEQIEKVQREIDVLLVEVSSLKTEIEKEKIELANLQQKEELASVEIPSIRAEIEKTKEQIEACMEKEKEAKRKIDELPSLIEEATIEVKRSKMIAQDAEVELNKVKAETEPILVSFKTIKMKINASMKEIEASKMSENIALAAIKALQESEINVFSEKMTISFEEYFDLSKKGHEAAEQAQERLDAVVAKIDTAKESATISYAVLYKVYNELDEKKKMLHETTQKGIKAAQTKMDDEQELKHSKEMIEEQCNNVKFRKDEVSEPADEVAKADIKVIKPGVATNGDTETDKDNKEEVKLDEAVNGTPTTAEPNKGVLDRSNLEDSSDGTNGCCLSGRRSFHLDDGTTKYQSLIDSPMVATGKKKRNFLRKFWTKRNAQSVVG
jgi:chromosome segregation ATPase